MSDDNKENKSENEQDIEFENDDIWADDEDDEELQRDLAKRRRTIRSAVVLVLVAALIGNVIAFWPRIYNMETLPFLFKSQQLSSRADIQSYKEAVVLVGTDKGKGTGFHVSDGYIVTNYHVIEDSAYSLVSFPGSSHSYRAEVAASSSELDIAILRIETEGRDLPHIELERDEPWQNGDPVYVIGNPLYFSQIAAEGHIAQLIPVGGRAEQVLALDAPVFKGNSGSPVINERGKAIAVVYATAEITLEGETKQVGLAVPLGDWEAMLDGLVLTE